MWDVLTVGLTRNGGGKQGSIWGGRETDASRAAFITSRVISGERAHMRTDNP